MKSPFIWILLKARTFPVREGEPDFLPEYRQPKNFQLGLTTVVYYPIIPNEFLFFRRFSLCRKGCGAERCLRQMQQGAARAKQGGSKRQRSFDCALPLGKNGKGKQLHLQQRLMEHLFALFDLGSGAKLFSGDGGIRGGDLLPIHTDAALLDEPPGFAPGFGQAAADQEV